MQLSAVASLGSFLSLETVSPSPENPSPDLTASAMPLQGTPLLKIKTSGVAVLRQTLLPVPKDKNGTSRHLLAGGQRNKPSKNRTPVNVLVHQAVPHVVPEGSDPPGLSQAACTSCFPGTAGA